MASPVSIELCADDMSVKFGSPNLTLACYFSFYLNLILTCVVEIYFAPGVIPRAGDALCLWHKATYMCQNYENKHQLVCSLLVIIRQEENEKDYAEKTREPHTE